MSASARFPQSNLLSATDPRPAIEALAFAPGDRIGALPRRRRRRWIGRAFWLAALGGAGWLHIEDPTRLSRWWIVAQPVVAEWLAVNEARPGAAIPVRANPEVAVMAPPPAAPVAPELSRAEGPVASSRAPAPEAVPVAPVVAAEPPSEAPPASADERPEPLPPPVATEPYQKRALAAGLHPDLSRAVLVKLTDADYRNAAHAIRSALGQTPDDGAFVWPDPARRGQALFRVHFVKGSAPDCRRYVVAIGRDGWATTALPMEKCGLAPSRRTSTR